MGKGARAYEYKHSKGSNTRYGQRSKEHAEYLDSLYKMGFLPHEWIIFHYRDIDKDEAKVKEKELIKKLKPIYNRKAGIKHLKFDINDVRKILKLRQKGLYYHQIGKQMNCGAMVVHRIINNKSPRYEEMLIEARQSV